MRIGALRLSHLFLDLLAGLLAKLLELLVRVLLVREEDRDLLSLLADHRGLRARLEQVQRLAVLLWLMKWKGER